MVLYMVFYGGVWCCIWVYGDVKGCLVMYGDVWCCIWVYGVV